MISREDELERVCVVLVGTRNPLNLGAAARAMSNFGFKRLRAVNPYEPAFREARSAVGASAVLESAEVYTSVAEAVADCVLVVGTTAGRHRELQHPLKRLDEGARLIRKELARRGTAGKRPRVALLFGSEKRGLSNQDFSFCHWLIRIPTGGEQVSMNLGQAVAVCLYELIRDPAAGQSQRPARRKDAPPEAQLGERADAGDLERITALLLEALRASGYLGARPAPAAEEKIRRLVRRMELSARDAELWLGMLRQMVWKMEQRVTRP